MKGLVCKYCGGNHFNKTKKGYECDYCHTVYELDEEEHSQEKNRRQKRPPIIRITLLVLVALLALTSSLISEPKKVSRTTKPHSLTSSESKPLEKKEYSASELSNPERNVRIAELSLNQEAIELAEASIAEYGGEKTAEFEQRVAAAQKDHDTLKKERVKQPPKEDMIIENPDSEFSVTMYYREGGFFTAYGPDFDQYSSQDILRLWGKPDEIITDAEKIKQNLTISFDENNKSSSYEVKMIRKSWQQGLLTWREVRALLIIAYDRSHGNYSKQFVYEKQGKPNVYFEGDKVSYVTPLVRYVAFNRLPEKYPRAGLGKYPDDFPENYGSDGRYHEK